MIVPGSSNPLLLKSAAASTYQVSRSLRFNGGVDSASLTRTPSVAGNRKTFTWSGWVKRSAITSTRYTLFAAGTSGSAETEFFFEQSVNANTLHFYHYPASYQGQCRTTAVFRDTSAWYHILLAVDTTQATASNRCKIYVNGVQQDTTFITNFTQNADLYINSTILHGIGYSPTEDYYFSGYLADIHFIDGQALTPSSFTETDATTGQLVPKAYGGSYGSNGFQLKFADNSSNTATTLGKDTSPNGNNWTPNNLSVTAGIGNDSLTDTPTSYGTDTGVGGEVRGNYATWNPLSVWSAGSAVTTISNGNLQSAFSSGSTVNAQVASTIQLSSGKWYCEYTPTNDPGANSTAFIFGVGSSSALLENAGFGVASVYGQLWSNGSNTNYWWSGTPAANDVFGLALNLDTNQLSFYRNGSQIGSTVSITSGLSYAIKLQIWQGQGTPTGHINFGQRAFSYTAPSGFKAICDSNLPAPVVAKPSSSFNVKLWTGTGATNAITGLGFSPDLVWIKIRSAAADHNLVDSVRVGTRPYLLYPNATNAENTSYTLGVQSLDSAGFTLGTDGDINGSGYTYAAWAWDAGTSTVSNTAGSITSQVRANATAGFSVATWSSGSGGTVGHGLGVAPALIIAKARTGASQWIVYHSATGVGGYLYLSATSAVGTNIANVWSPVSSTVFNVNNGLFPTPYDYVSYHFAPVSGYSSMSSFVGNGSSDGPFVYTGFRPRWLLIKRSDGIRKWMIFDTARLGYNPDNNHLSPDQSNAEDPTDMIDILSNGFKLRIADADVNASGGTYIYFAVAENPFAYARAR